MDLQTRLRQYLRRVLEMHWVQAACQLLYLGSPLFLVAVFQGLAIKYDWLASLKKPMDLGVRIHGKRILGDHKTWRGAVINTTFCVVGSLIQMGLQPTGMIPHWLPLYDYGQYGLLAGLLMGMGMTFGELPNSFLKRQLGIAPGLKGRRTWRWVFFLCDQVDLTIGIWIFMFLLIRPSLWLLAYSLLLTIILHMTVSIVGYFLGMRKTIV
jgi:CDP-diglyceride synthetase